MKAYLRVSGRILELGFIHLRLSHILLGSHSILELLYCRSQNVLRCRKLTQRQVRLLMANQELGSSLYSLKKPV